VEAAVFEFEETGDTVGLEFTDTLVDVLGQDEVEERLLLVVVVGEDQVLVFDDTVLASDGSQGEGDVGENVEEIAVLGTDEFPDLGELLGGVSLFGEALEELGAGVGMAPDFAELVFVAEKVGEIPKELLEELLGGQGRPVWSPEAG